MKACDKMKKELLATIGEKKAVYLKKIDETGNMISHYVSTHPSGLDQVGKRILWARGLRGKIDALEEVERMIHKLKC